MRLDREPVLWRLDDGLGGDGDEALGDGGLGIRGDGSLGDALRTVILLLRNSEPASLAGSLFG